MYFEEALKELRKGKKIRNRNWCVGAWYRMSKIEEIVDQFNNCGYLNWNDLLRDDWEIVEEPKKETKFEIGERIIFYTVQFGKLIGNILDIKDELIKMPFLPSSRENYVGWVHEKQCRRIKKKC